MAYYDTFLGSNQFEGERRLGIGGMTGGSGASMFGGVGGFPSMGQAQPQPGFGGPGNTSEAWANGVNRVDRFARDFGISSARAGGLFFGRIDARSPQAQVRTGLQTPTMTGTNSLTDSAAWAEQFKPKSPATGRSFTPSWQQPGIRVGNREYQQMRGGGYNSTLPDPYA